MPSLVQSAANCIAKGGPGDQGSASCKATFTTPTTPGSYVLAAVVTAGGIGITHTLTSGWTKLYDDASGDLQMSLWGRENCPATSSVTAYTDAYRSVQIRAVEYSGVRQASAQDRLTYREGESSSMSTGSSGTTTQADELIVGVLANQYDTTTQGSFSGGLTKIYESTSPRGSTQDWECSRYTLHQANTSSTGSFTLAGALSTSRKWLGVLVTLKGGTTGPARLTSTMQPALYAAGGNRGSKLTVFGPLRSTAQPALYYAATGIRARMGPFGDQFLLGGWSGLLVGANTPYAVEELEGLEGWDVRTSDDDLPRDAGALRGVDLQGARLIGFKLNIAGTRSQIETRVDALKRVLVPQRDSDWELIYRMPGQPLKSVYVRPTTLVRALTGDSVFLQEQPVTLRAADPRHYAALISTLSVPITANRNSPSLVSAYNVGSANAYPIIRINGPTSGAATRVVLTNATTGGRFDVAAALGVGAELVGDMRSRVAGLPVSAVTIDGQNKYGGWQPPRTPFALAPGINNLMFEVEPSTATSVTCSLEWRSTWSG